MNNLPKITKHLLIINVLFYLAALALQTRGVNLNDYLGLHFIYASDFMPYQLLTYMFMHASFTHLLFNMLAVFMFGRIIEMSWGAKRYLIYYLVCGVGAGVIQELAQLADYYATHMNQYDQVNIGTDIISMDAYLNLWNTVGASGAVYGVLLAFGLCYPDERMFIFPIPFPIKAKFFVMIYAVIELFLGLQSGGDGVAHFAHLGGMLVGFLLIVYWSSKSSFFSSGYVGKIRAMFTRKKPEKKPKMTVNYAGFDPDKQYNARRKEDQDEVDRILDKLKKSGYQSLTVDEKKKLFEASSK